jgi:thiamine-phosphate diphosphorylase
VHSVSAAQEAERLGADYLQIGTIFATESKPGVEPSGPALLREAVDSLTIPCLAVGGIDDKNAASLMSSGAAGVAVVSAILQSEDIAAAVAKLHAALGYAGCAIDR